MTDSNCPPWCTGTHPASTDIHEGPVHPLRSAKGAQMWSQPVIWETGPRVTVTAFANGIAGSMVCDQENAGELANVLDALASTAPADIRAFAAQVRQTSAQAFAEPEAEPEAEA